MYLKSSISSLKFCTLRLEVSISVDNAPLQLPAGVFMSNGS